MIYSVAARETSKRRQAPLAQSAERLHGKEKVNGSIPLGGSSQKAPPNWAGPLSCSLSVRLQARDAHGQNRHVVGRRVGGEALDRAHDAGRDRAGRQARAGGEDVGEAVVAEHAGAFAALGDAVRDTEKDVARVEGDRLLVELQVLHDAEERLGFGGRFDGAVLAQAEREGVAGTDDLQAGAAVSLRPQLAVEEGQEAAAGALVEDRGVQALQDRRAAEALASEQPEGVPGEARNRRRVRARTADVADGEPVGAVADGEDVVEVATDLVALAGRAVDDLDLHAVDLGEFGWQEAALEGLADGGALGVEAGVVQGEGGPAGQVLGQFQDLLAEVFVRRLAEGQ